MKIKPFKAQLVGFLSAAALVANFASGCGAKADAGTEKAATSAAQTWLAVIDNGDYVRSWQNASALFQNAVTEEKWKTSVEMVRKPLGDLVSRKLKSTKATAELPGAPAGQYVVMQFETSFANKKSAIETVTFMLEKDGQWKSAGYFIK
ncbi:MAG: DUF4019 domain-containing protein [Verrucomicrobiota bacterium]|jgi:hypothetical protein